MKLTISSTKQNPLLKRKEIGFEVSDFSITPSRKEILDSLVSETGSKHGTVAITRMKQWFGAKKIEGNANAYDDANALKKTEKRFFIERTEGKQQKEKKEQEKAEK